MLLTRRLATASSSAAMRHTAAAAAASPSARRLLPRHAAASSSSSLLFCPASRRSISSVSSSSLSSSLLLCPASRRSISSVSYRRRLITAVGPVATTTTAHATTVRHFFFSKKKTPEEVAEEAKRTPMSAAGEKLLYEGSQEFHIRMMFGVGCVNVLYWSWWVANCYMYKDVVHQGINFGGDPRWGFVGAAGTLLIFYATREYSSHAAYYVYETADGRRLGFQLHTILGLPGRKIEASIGNVRLANTIASSTGSSFVPLRVEGVGKNVLIDRDGTYYANGRLMELLQAGAAPRTGSAVAGGSSSRASAAVLDSKENRVTWKKQEHQKRKQR